MLDQRLVTEAEPAPSREVSARTDPRAGAGMPREQADAKDREARGGDSGEAEQPRAAASREGRAREHAGTRAGGSSQQVVEAHG